MLNFCMIYKQKFYTYQLKSRFAQLDWKGIPLVFLREGRSQPKTKYTLAPPSVRKSRVKEVFKIRTVIHYVHIRSTVVLFKTTGQLRELGETMDFPEVRNSNFGSPGTT